MRTQATKTQTKKLKRIMKRVNRQLNVDFATANKTI